MKATSAFSFIQFKGKILIIKDRRGRWTLPGGQIDKGECPAKAAKRETFEETTLAVKTTKKKKTTKKYSKGKKKAVVFKSKSKRTKVRLSVEHVEFAWVTPEQAVDMLIIRHAVALVHLF